MDTNSKAMDDACLDMLKNGVRRMRYRLKKKYFNGVPANQLRTTSPVDTMTDAQWKKLVDMWTTSAHKKRVCQARKTVGRSSCRSGQGLGAILHMHMLRYKKADMEAIVAETGQEGQEPSHQLKWFPKSCQSQAHFFKMWVLSLLTRQDLELQAQLDAEKQESVGHREELDSLKTKAQESKAKIDSLLKKQDQTNALLCQLISFSHGPVNSTSLSKLCCSVC
ncbi:hypothetical protein BS78_03G159700 [Paspalum vaginatum]|nr:hypothetical protein BS78_03G159700 [Paspalum vaginatum]